MAQGDEKSITSYFFVPAVAFNKSNENGPKILHLNSSVFCSQSVLMSLFTLLRRILEWGKNNGSKSTHTDCVIPEKLLFIKSIFTSQSNFLLSRFLALKGIIVLSMDATFK